MPDQVSDSVPVAHAQGVIGQKGGKGTICPTESLFERE